MANDSEFIRRALCKPLEKRCVDCAYCSRSKYLAGKWYCNHPDVHVGVPVEHDLPCFVRRGSREAAERGI